MFSNVCTILIQVLVVTVSTAGAAEKRYEIHATYDTWYSALALCNRMGGRLARIPDAQTQERVATEIRNQGLDYSDFWFDLHDLHSENEWSWNNGDRQEYFNWAPGEPNNGNADNFCGGGQDCAQLWSLRDFTWDDTTCCEEQGVICEFDIVNTTSAVLMATSMQTRIMGSTDSNVAKTTASMTSSSTTLSATTEQTLSTLGVLCASVSDMTDKPDPKAEKIISYETSTSPSSGSAVNTILLVISIINFIVLLCVVVFLYMYVWRKIRQGVIQAPTYQDLVNQQTESYKNFE